MEKPQISVVMPAYNHEAYVAEAIQSVLSQTLQNFELIIVNDGSTDRTENVILGFDDARIRYLSQSNQGAHHALNRGISLAQGDYIAIINSDDVFIENRLEILLDTLQRGKLDFLISDIHLIDGDSGIICDPSHWWLKWYEDLKQKFQQTPSTAAAFLAGNYAITSSNFFFRAQLVQQIGLFRPFRYILDYDFAFRAALINPSAFSFLIGQKLLNYRLHADNTIAENPLLANVETLYFLKKSMIKYFGHELNIPLYHLNRVKGLLNKIQKAHFIHQNNALQHQNNELQHQNNALQFQNSELQGQNNELQLQNNQLHNHNMQLIHELALFKNSRSYLVGRAITAPYRWVALKWQNTINKKRQTIKDSAGSVVLLRAKLEQYVTQAKVISFDIFDTLLERDIDPPDEVKQIVAKRIIRVLSDDYDINCTAAHVIALRNTIENDLRLKGLNAGRDYECKFSDIAKELASRLAEEDLALIAPLTARIIEHELEVETEVLFVKRDIAAVLAWLNSRGIRVIAVSDMYLDQTLLHSIFEKKGLSAHFDHIYVSSESGIGKHSGRLFEHVLRQENLQPAELLHIGDNHHSDYRSPARMGIHTIHFDDKASIRRRQTLRAYRYLARKNPYWRGRHLLQMIRPAESQGFHYNYGYEILGPIYATFILGIIEEIKKNGIRQIYFLAREGELFMKLFQLLCSNFFEPDQIPAAHYLYVSRRSTATASAHNGLTYEAAIVPLFNPKQEGLYSICKAFGLPSDEFTKVSKKHGYSNIKQPIYDWESSQFKGMLNDPEFQQIVRHYTTESWHLLHTYLAQHDFFAEKQAAVVDIGWNGSIQKFLQEAFGTDKNYPHVFGLYLGFIGGIQHSFDSEKNTLLGILCDERGKARPEDIFSRFEEIFEEGARALHPTTIGYQVTEESGKVDPIFKQDSDYDRLAELSANPDIAQFQAGVIDFTSEFVRAVDLTGYRFKDIKPFILTLTERAIAFPTSTESHQLMQLGHSEDFGSENVMNFHHEKFNGWNALLKPRSLIRKLATANWKYGTASSLGIPGLNMIIRFYDLLKSK